MTQRQPDRLPDGRLAGRLIGLGVTGSIAAYKAVELLRALRAEDADVCVMLTPSATRFVGPLTFAALSRHPVEMDLMDLLPDGRIGHIVVADTADAIVVAPATAHWLGAIANGLAGDVVTATCLAFPGPVVVAPAMDGDMWTHPATRDNTARLHDAFGYRVVPPGEGPLASGQSGVGRLAEIEAIVDAVVAAVGDRPIRARDPAARPPLAGPARDADLEGRHIVVTAGGTREAIDPVRFIGNRSSGKQGFAIAWEAAARGAAVTIVSTVRLEPPAGARVVAVESAAEMERACRELAPDADIVVMSAAVADFRPSTVAGQKIKKGPDGDVPTVVLERTPDILARLGASKPAGQILVGFAAETEDLAANALGKLRRKHLDLIVANDVSAPGVGFEHETNAVSIFSIDGSRRDVALSSKRAIAAAVLDAALSLRNDRVVVAD